MPQVIAPAVGYDDAYFWDGVRAGQLLLRRCANCGYLQHPPGPMCPRCGSLSWTVQEASGRGTVYSWIRSHHPNDPDADPRIVVLVELEEGVRLVSNLVRVAPDDVDNGMAVTVCFERFDDDVVLPQFEPAIDKG
jgi:uncharacterized OB-fold protein